MVGRSRRRAPRGGCTGLTEDGELALRRWMGVVKEERDGLDRVLRRYRASATPQALLADAGVRSEVLVGAAGHGDVPRVRRRPDHRPARGRRPSTAGRSRRGARSTGPTSAQCTYRLLPDRSAVLIEARSSVGPITFGALGITGYDRACRRSGSR